MAAAISVGTANATTAIRWRHHRRRRSSCSIESTPPTINTALRYVTSRRRVRRQGNRRCWWDAVQQSNSLAHDQRPTVSSCNTHHKSQDKALASSWKCRIRPQLHQKAASPSTIYVFDNITKEYERYTGLPRYTAKATTSSLHYFLYTSLTL